MTLIDSDRRHNGLVARAGNIVTVVSRLGWRSHRSATAVRIRTAQAAVLLTAGGLLLAGCGGSSQASSSTTVTSAAAASTRPSARQIAGGRAFCSAARRFGREQKAFSQYAQSEPASVVARVFSVAKNAATALASMQRLAPASLAADVKVYERTEKPIVDIIVANRGQLKQAIGTMRSGSEKSGSPKLQRALIGIGDKCGFPGSVLMAMPKKGMPMQKNR
jgi:hypothetical protein